LGESAVYVQAEKEFERRKNVEELEGRAKGGGDVKDESGVGEVLQGLQ
jgi:hypothetical protein